MNLDKNGIATGNTKEDKKQRKQFIIEKVGFGKIKLTVGELRGSGQKIQYCITAIEND